MRMDPAGSIAAITGASSGIGEATARRLAKEGMHVALGARRGGRLKELAHEIEEAHGVDALPVTVDVQSMDEVQRFADRTREAFGGVDLVFANAGRPGRGRVEELSEETFQATLDVNLTGAFRTAKAFLPLLRGREGTRALVFTGSVAGRIPMPASSAYCASKHGLRGFARSLAQEIAEEGIRTTVIQPGYVNTAWHDEDPGRKDMVQPEDIAQLVLDLFELNGTAMLDEATVWPARMY